MGGSTKTVSTAPRETAGLRAGVTNYLMGGGQPAMPAAQPKINPFHDPKGFADMLRARNNVGVPTGGPQPAGPSPYDRINATMVGQPQAATVGPVNDIQSVDQLGGATSQFFQNMMSQLQPAFNQQRAETAATAKEASGNLTGSGFANILGTALNRSLGQEQATAAQFAQQAIAQELQRQQVNQATQAQIAAQNAGFQQQANLTQFQTANEIANQNAQRFMQMLMGMSTAGLGPDQIVQRGGIGSVLAPIAGIAGSFLGGPAGGVIASNLFGGGQKAGG